MCLLDDNLDLARAGPASSGNGGAQFYDITVVWSCGASAANRGSSSVTEAKGFKMLAAQETSRGSPHEHRGSEIMHRPPHLALDRQHARWSSRYAVRSAVTEYTTARRR